MSYNSERRPSNEDREMFDAVCSECKSETQVPFKPDPDRPVFCRDCFRSRRNNRY